MVSKEHITDFIAALTESSNAIEIVYIKQHGVLLLLEVLSFLADVHANNPFYSELVAKSAAAMTQARAFFATGIPVADADYTEFNHFNPCLSFRPIAVKLRAFPDQVLKRKAEEIQSALGFFERFAGSMDFGVQLILATLLNLMRDLKPHLQEALQTPLGS